MKTGYKYSLEIGSKKYFCPECGKKTFVRLVDENGQHLGEKYGRCDREIKCGYFERPHGEQGVYFKKPHKENSDEFSITPIWEMKKTFGNYGKNELIRTMAERWGVEAVQGLMEKFYIGTGSGKYHGWTVFWQVDNLGYIRTGHLMQYQGLKRTKYQTWSHALSGEKYRLNQCLFGLNQLKNVPDVEHINVVESEKTALICSIFFPNETWMAAAGRHGLKYRKLIWLYPHPVRLYPDTDSIEHWGKIAGEMKNVSVFDWQRDFIGYPDEIKDLPPGSDIADFLEPHSVKDMQVYRKPTVWSGRLTG